jgi:hypothetical protein
MIRLIFGSLIVTFLLSCDQSPEAKEAKMLEEKLKNAADIQKAKADSLDLAAKHLRKQADSARDMAKELKDSSKAVGN